MSWLLWQESSSSFRTDPLRCQKLSATCEQPQSRHRSPATTTWAPKSTLTHALPESTLARTMENRSHDNQVLDHYLSCYPPAATGTGPVVRKSTLTAALDDARTATSRDGSGTCRFDAGADGDTSGSWLGAIGYLMVLDQLGSAVKHRSSSATDVKRSFERTLHDFPGDLKQLVPDSDEHDKVRHKLYGLRCALAHDFSLTNDCGADDPRTALFRLDRDTRLIQLPEPQSAWKGHGHPANPGAETRISLRALGDLVESVVRQICTLHTTGDVEIALAGGAAEMELRCFFEYSE